MPDTIGPNVLIFCVDEMRADHMGCAGHSVVRTPSLDRIAARGTRFDRSYCNNPICMPARTTMFTGLLPRDHGVRINGMFPTGDWPTLPGVFRDAGYRTHAAGKLHLTPYVPQLDPPDPQRCPEDMHAWNRGEITAVPTPYFGFDEVDFVGGHTSFVFGQYIDWLKERGGDPALLKPDAGLDPEPTGPMCYRMALDAELHYNRYITDRTIGVIDDHAADPGQPFFAWCSLPDPHAPVAPPRPYDTMYDPADVSLPIEPPTPEDGWPPLYDDVLMGSVRPNGVDHRGVNEQGLREMLALTYGMVSHLDAEVGRVLDALDRHQLWDNTIVVFLSDHGDMMGDHGLLWKAFYTFDGCIRIPTIVAAPGHAKGHCSSELIAQIDLMPSLCELAGLDTPGEAWRDMDTPFERGSYQPLRTYPGRSWANLLHKDSGTNADQPSSERQPVVIENDDPTTGLQPRCLVTDRYRLTVYGGQTFGELFDLHNDPQERRNLWDSPAHRNLRGELCERLVNAYAHQTAWHPMPPWNS